MTALPVPIDIATMANIAREVLGIPLEKKYTEKRDDETYRGFFGASIDVITILWNRIQPNLTGQDSSAGAHPKHLFWALVFLKVYSTTLVHCRIVGWPDPKTYRKWSWYFVRKIADLKFDVIVFDNRFDQWNGSSQALISIDGIDCMVNEPWPFDTKYYSQKCNGPARKYEIGVCICTGSIVWIHGPHKAGKADATIFKEHLASVLLEKRASRKRWPATGFKF